MDKEKKPEGSRYKYKDKEGNETVYLLEKMSDLGKEIFRRLQNCEQNRLSINEAVDNNDILQAHYRNILHKELGIGNEGSKGEQK